MKKILFIFHILLLLMLVSCVNNDPPVKPIGTIPTKEFTVNPIISDNAIYKEKSQLMISGTAEGNVGIKVELVNKGNKVIATKEVLTDSETLNWSVTLTTPKGSYDSYKLKVSDTFSKFKKTYSNIRFGLVYMIIGDNYQSRVSTDSEEDFNVLIENKNIGFFSQTLNGGKWFDTIEDYNNLSDYVKNFSLEMYETNNVPTAIMMVCEDDTFLREWLFKDVVDSHTFISTYLQDKGMYVDNPSQKGEMAYLGEALIKPLKGISVNAIIWIQGQMEMPFLEDQEYANIYFQMLYTLFNSWREYFYNFEVVILQAGNDTNPNVINLRTIQKTVADYYSFVTIIPTIDLIVKLENETVETDFAKLAKRTKDIIKNNIEVSKFDNLVLEIDPLTEVVSMIQIEFNNTERILVEILDESNLINYFKVYYNDPEKGQIVLDVQPIIKDNTISVDLRYEEEVFNEDGEIEIIKKVYDKSLIDIEYGYESDLSNVNLFNDSGIPILPFRINID